MPLFASLADRRLRHGRRIRAASAVASNIANANSVGASSGAAYRAREVVFQAVSSGTTAPSRRQLEWRGSGLLQSWKARRRCVPLTSPAISFADANGYVTMPNVNPVEEMVNMISAQQDYQANLEAFNVAKTLALRTLTI